MIGIAANNSNYKHYLFAFLFWLITSILLIVFLPEDYKPFGMLVLPTIILHSALLDYYYMRRYPPHGDPDEFNNNRHVRY